MSFVHLHVHSQYSLLDGFSDLKKLVARTKELGMPAVALTDHGTIVLKYWLHISHAEQLRRFREREAAAHKRHKMNAEDWRNRRQRAAYEAAVGDMLALTDREQAPWHLVPADNKRYARLEVLRTAARRIEAALKD